TAFYVMCFVPFVIEAAGIYISHSAAARALLEVRMDALQFTHADFFFGALTIQGALAFLLTAWIAPVLVSPDLVNGALPLYLSRPFSRPEYVLGKASILFALLSSITWVPGVALFALQAGLEPGWAGGHLRIAGAIVAGAWVWILVLTLLGLA